MTDAFPLTPMQRGMLAQTLATPGGGVYSIVASYRLRGPLDGPTLLEAWRRLVQHHPVLRTSFHWADRVDAVQRVEEAVTLEALSEDWRAHGASEQASRLRALMVAEQRRGFDLTAAPLLRVALVRTGDEAHELVVAHHHILFDGSSKALLFAQVFAIYQALLAGRPVDLPTPAPYRTFVDWLRVQPLGEAEGFWRGVLDGFSTPSRLWHDPTGAAVGDRDYDEHRVRLDAEASQRLRTVAREHRLTVNTFVTAAWALLLSRVGNTDDVVFGASVNTRPPDLDGADTMLGLFINTVPVRVRVEPGRTVAEWLKGLQWSQADAREHAYVPLPTILKWSDVAAGQDLFESVVVFENNAGYDGRVERYGDIEVLGVDPLVRTSVPLTLRCVPGQHIECHLLHDARRFSAGTISAIGGDLVETMSRLAEAMTAPVSMLQAALDARARAREQRQTDAYHHGIRGRLQAIRAAAGATVRDVRQS